jgi:Ca-activated chloride channel family protein
MDVDRDPVPSPDPEDNASVNPAAPAGKEQPNGTLQKQHDGSYTMHAEVDEVLLSCTVIDEKGKSVTDLDRKAFHVFEDGVPEATTSFQHQDLPVSIGILVDNSGSMRDKRQAVKTAALNLLRASNALDTEFVVNFSERAFLDQGFTSDMQAVDRGLSHFDSSGTTALYDAVAASADELSHHAKQPKQVLLIITDGADNASRLNLEQAIRRVQSLGGPVVYTIGLLYGTEKQEALRARQALESLSEETGGIAYFPTSLENVDEIASEVARDIRNQYTIGYRSSKPSNLGGYRTVHVEAGAAGYKKLVVRTRRGYYSKPQQPAQTAQQAQP